MILFFLFTFADIAYRGEIDEQVKRPYQYKSPVKVVETLDKEASLMFGSTELIIILLIVFILFGAKSLPKIAKSIGEARKEFQKGLDDKDSENPSSKSSDKDSSDS